MKKVIVGLLVFFLLLNFTAVFAQNNNEEVEINFFYSKTCPHCAKEAKFLDEIEKEYPSVEINRYLINNNVQLLRDLFQKYDISKDKFGAVPAIFIEDKFFLGFDNEEGVGSKIEKLSKKNWEALLSRKMVQARTTELNYL